MRRNVGAGFVGWTVDDDEPVVSVGGTALGGWLRLTPDEARKVRNGLNAALSQIDRQRREDRR